MRENEFEKRVQDKMGELKLVPSAEVWDSVERRIRKEKKRRLGVWWLLALLLAGGGITAGILLGGNKKEKQPLTVENKTTKEIKPEPGTPGENATTTENKDTKKEPVTTPTIKSEPVVTTTSTESSIPLIPIPGNKTEQTPVKPSRERVHTDKRITVPPDKKEPSLPLLKEPKPPVVKKEPTVSQPIAKEEIQKEKPVPVQQEQKEKANEPEKKDLVKVTAENPVDKPIKAEPVVNKTETIPSKEPETRVMTTQDSTTTVAGNKAGSPNKKTWKWGLSVSYGRSVITEGPGLFSKSNRLADAAGLQTGSPSQLASYSRNSYDPAKAWSAGFWVRTQLAPRLFGEAELGYMHLSNKIAVGSRVDSTRLVNNTYSQGVSVSNFYRPSSGQTFTNQYHFLRLSASVSWQFLHNKKFRPEWENGLEYNRLMGSNMLHWDWNLPGYYQDNKLLTKNHLFYHTGLSIPAGNRVLVNPFTSFSLTRVLRDNDSLRTNFSQWGIRLKIALGKK